MSRRIFHCATLIKLRLLQGQRSSLIDDEDDDPSKFSSDSESEDAQQCTKLSKSRVSQRHRNREATIAHVSGRYTIDIIFARLSTKFFVEKLRGPLLQPEVRAVQVKVLIYAAQSCSRMPIATLRRRFPQVRAAH